MDELESAVLLCLNPVADKDLRDRALQYCQNIRQSQDGWAFVLQRLSTSMRPEVAFWCFQVIHETLSDSLRYPATFSADHVVGIRTKLLEYFSQAVYPERFLNGTAQNGTTSTEAASFPFFLLNKLSQVFVSLIAADYPQTWPTAFQDTILPLVNSPQATESSTLMFFRILRTLDEDVTSIRATQISDATRKTSIRVKDAMRDDCIVELMARCSELIASPRYVSQAFDIVARYVEWVDIGLIVQDQILRPMYGAITSRSPCNARPAAAVALRAIVMKRMDSTAKVNLMNALRIETLLRSIPVNEICANEDEAEDSELNLQTGQVEVAALVNTIAVVVLEILKDNLKQSRTQENAVQVSSAAGSIAQVALPVALRFLDEDADEGTSSQTLQCVTTYVNVFSRVAKNSKNGTPDDGIAAMVAILKVVEERALFARDFDPQDDKSDEQRAFLELRRVLLKSIFRSVVRTFPGMCLEFVNSLFIKASSADDVARTELALAMLIVFMATSPETPELTDLRRNVIANPPACMEFDTDLAPHALDRIQLAQRHQLELVSTTYFDLVARSYRLFLTRADPSLLSTVLPVFFDRRGLGHKSSETVRSRAAYSLLKLTRPLRGIVTGSQVDAILNAVRAYMFPLSNDVHGQTSKDQMMIFETVGYLLGTDHNREGSMQYLSAILQPIGEGLQTNSLAEAIPFITAAGFLSKGFGGDSKPLLLLNESQPDQQTEPNASSQATSEGSGKEVKVQRVTPLAQDMQMVWISCLEAVLKAAAPCFQGGKDLSLEELRSKVLFFLHRMVDTIGVAVLPYLERIVPDLLNLSASAVELRDVIILVSQAVTKFGDSSEGLAMRVYSPMVQRVHQHSYTLDPTSLMAMSEESREAVEMHRAYTYFLHAIVGTKLIGLLIHPHHQALMQGVMTSLLSSAVGESLDLRVAASVMKMSLHMLGQMVERWTRLSADSARNNGPAGFSVFALNEISKATVLSAVRGSVFRLGDYDSGEAVSVLTEIVTLQRTCASHLGREFAEAVQNGPLNALPKGNVDTYLSALYSPHTPTATLVPALAALARMLRAI